jgi:hypothetical protein
MMVIAVQHTSQVQWSQVATVAAHLFMGALLFVRARATDLTSSKSIYSCYMCVHTCARALPHLDNSDKVFQRVRVASEFKCICVSLQVRMEALLCRIPLPSTSAVNSRSGRRCFVGAVA